MGQKRPRLYQPLHRCGVAASVGMMLQRMRSERLIELGGGEAFG